MKIRFTNKYGSWSCAHTGKGKFAQRIIDEWVKGGIEVTHDVTEPVDIDLQISRFVYEPRYCKKVVLRVGPVEYDTNIDYLSRNKEMRHCQKHADGIIYQSAFAEKAHRSLVWNATIPSVVIFNGADPRFYEALEPWESPFSVNFLASTREWVWEKRLPDLIAAFKVAAVPDSCLWILGNTWEHPKRFPPYQKHIHEHEARHNIRFVGELASDETIGRFLRMATCMLHAVYIDACPNAIAEALSARCPVVATCVGGQAELDVYRVGGDPPWDFHPRDRRRPPPLNLTDFASTMRLACANGRPVRSATEGVDIRNTARQYLDFFRRLLGE